MPRERCLWTLRKGAEWLFAPHCRRPARQVVARVWWDLQLTRSYKASRSAVTAVARGLDHLSVVADDSLSLAHSVDNVSLSLINCIRVRSRVLNAYEGTISAEVAELEGCASYGELETVSKRLANVTLKSGCPSTSRSQGGSGSDGRTNLIGWPEKGQGCSSWGV